MDPTLDPTPERHGTPTDSPSSDLAAVVARVARIEQRIDALEQNQRTLIASLPARGRPNPPIVPSHTGPAVPSRPSPASAAPAPAAMRTWSTDWPPATTPAPALMLAPREAITALPATSPAVGSADAPADEWSTVPPMKGWRPTPTEPARPGPGLPDLSAVSPGRLLAWVGGAALVLGAVFFFSLAFSRGWITEPMRVLIGLVAGASLLGASVVTFDRRGPVVAHVLAAAGIAILELALYAARLFGLVPAEVALFGATIVAAAAMAIAIRFDSQPVAALGLLAVLAAPPIMQAPASLTTVGFLSIVLVAASAVAIARGWRWLPWLAFAVTLPQLFAWLWAAEVADLLASSALLGYWAVLASAAIAEMWRRPLPLRRDPSGLLLVLVGLAVAGLVVITLGLTEATGMTVLVLGGLHVAAATPFLRDRRDRDAHGRLLVGTGAPWLALGICLAVPDMLVPIGLVSLAAALGVLSARRNHRYALVEGLLVALLAAGWLAVDAFPVGALPDLGFPPVGGSTYGLAGSALIVGGLLAVITAAARWSAATLEGRSAIVASGVVLVAWALPFEVGGLGLVTAWSALAVVAMAGAIRLSGLRLRRLSLPFDPLLLTGAAAGMVATAWGIAGFALPTGEVDLLSPVVVDRVLASLLPVIGLVTLLATLRGTWWRGALAAVALVLLTSGTWLVAGSATRRLGGPFAVSLDGELVVLVGWSALALTALVLDERPRLRLASPRLLTRDPSGHPLALTALVPAIAALAWLAVRFLAGGAGGDLPAVPFTDETTLATGLVVGFLLVAAAAARTTLVRAVLVVTSVVLVAVLLPLELPLAMAVLGWSLMAIVTLIVSRRLAGPYARTARELAGGLIATAIGATLLVIAPPDRLVLELTRVPPDAGPPNVATLATVAVAAALAVAAWCCRATTRWAAWLWVGAGTALGWGVSVAIADAFALRIANGADAQETARQAQVALSIAWASMGLGTMLVGLLRDVGPARQAGLGLLAVATVKVFVYDLATLDIAYRVLSLVGLGVLLLVSAWLYLHARHRGGPEAMGR